MFPTSGFVRFNIRKLVQEEEQADKTIGFRDIGNLRFYSQYAGVKREYQAHGLGILIKEFQREIVRDVLGIRTVICTYDPLTGVNAYRNIHHFGMEVLQYRVATYGEYGGLLNRSDVATDRFLMAWDLSRPPRGDSAGAELPAAGIAHVLRVDVRRVRGKTSVLDLEVVRDADLGVGGDAVLVQIPRDFYEMLQETDVEDADVRRIPVDWRLHTRRAFQSLFERGYRVIDFLKSEPARPGNFYIIKRP